MKKIPIFTLVRNVESSDDTGFGSEASRGLGAKYHAEARPRNTAGKKNDEQRVVETSDRAIKQAFNSKKLQNVYASLDENFKATLRSLVKIDFHIGGDAPAVSVNENIKKITEDLAREDKVLRVGILDLGAWLGELPMLLERLNAVQGMFTLFEILAPVPAGLVKTPEGFSEWIKSGFTNGFAALEKDPVVTPQMIFDDYHTAAEDIRKGMGLDMLVAFTPFMVAGDDEGKPFANHFAATLGDSTLISTADLREYAEKAGRPFEAAVGTLLVACLFVAIVEGLEYHDDTGCIFDYNDNRVSLVEDIKALVIDKPCLEKMTPEQSKVANSMLGVLKRMKRRKLE